MLDVRFDFTLGNFARYAPPLGTLVTLVTLAYVHALTPFTAVLAYVAPQVVSAILAGIYLMRAAKPAFDDLRRSVRRLLGYGMRICGSDILATFGQQIDQLLVVAFLSAGQLGAYTIALQASRVLTIFQISLNTVLLPKAAGLPTHSVLELVARTARLTIAITAVAGVALIVLLPLLLPGLYGRDFASAILVSQILAVEAVLSAGASTHTQAFTATDRPGMATLFQLGGLATAVPLMLVLIPRLGLVGAALALLASTFLRLALAIGAYPLLLGAAIPKLIVTGSDLRYLARSLRRSPPSTGPA
jgi:O-antigen/teichoic acid export membrane protein